MPQEKFTNSLIHESSPYLLQHAHNPVNWLAWGDQAFESAQTQNKLVIISIGYSACHWCHVMEHQTFEDGGAADLMNKHFISIKVDREERPDVDQIYMTALQLMTGRGGWPLNIIALPDGRPVWGGTYFPKENWMEVLRNIADMYKNEPEKINDYAENLTAGVRQAELVQLNTADADFKSTDADFIFANWQKNFDTTEGGMSRAPKFPLPNNYEYLLQYGHLTGNEDALKHVRLTLFKMAGGGIYDQIGGGFARYSVDDKWVAPHFEKMLYDNSQLVSLYAKVHQKFKDPLYAKIVHETLEWLQREMTGPDGEFYSALDADSEGEEGKFYVWTESELRQIIPDGDWEYFEKYYNLKKGQWEGKIILLRSDFEVASANAEIWKERERQWKELLFQKRSSRIRPGLDDKSLTSWNAMMITALVNANHLSADHFSENEYLNRAIKTADWILNKQVRKDNSLYHSYKQGKSSINGFIEDYAFGIEAFLKLFDATFDEKYLIQATKWMDYAKQNFEDPTTSLFYTRSSKGKQLIAKSLETIDNVIPASNSVMAKNLFTLSHYLDKTDYRIQAEKMLNQMNKERLLQYGDNYSNWAQLLLQITYPYYEIAISGKSAGKKYRELKTHYIPNAVFIGSANESSLPLLENRYVEGETYIYVCREKVCQLPVKETARALEEIKL